MFWHIAQYVCAHHTYGLIAHYILFKRNNTYLLSCKTSAFLMHWHRNKDTTIFILKCRLPTFFCNFAQNYADKVIQTMGNCLFS